MLFDNIWNDKKDRFYFMYAFACRVWLSFLLFLFSPIIAIRLSFTLSGTQIFIVAASFLTLAALDFCGATIKAVYEYRAIKQTQISHHGEKKFR